MACFMVNWYVWFRNVHIFFRHDSQVEQQGTTQVSQSLFKLARSRLPSAYAVISREKASKKVYKTGESACLWTADRMTHGIF